MAKLRALWSGSLPLGEAFWTYAVSVGLAINLLTFLLFLILLSWDRPIAALMVGHVFTVPYNLVALVGVWRSAARYEGERIHAHLARIVTLVGMAALGGSEAPGPHHAAALRCAQFRTDDQGRRRAAIGEPTAANELRWRPVGRRRALARPGSPEGDRARRR